jgi:hypothetical protein
MRVCAQDWLNHAQSIVRSIGMTAQVASRYVCHLGAVALPCLIINGRADAIVLHLFADHMDC